MSDTPDEFASTLDTDTLEVIADWREDLLARIARTQIIFELHDCETDIEPLREEAAAFARVCVCLAWRGDHLK